MSKTVKLYFLVFVCGAIMGLSFDMMHVVFNVLVYEKPHFWGTSLWVLLEFGGGAVACLGVMNLLKKKYDIPSPSIKKVVLEAFLLFLAYLVTGVFVGKNTETLIGLAAISSVSIYVSKYTFEKIGWIVFPVIGPLFEISFSKLGLFHYLYGNPVPYWLPVLWFIASGFFINATSFIVTKMD